jgi:hypothetical protein
MPQGYGESPPTCRQFSAPMCVSGSNCQDLPGVPFSANLRQCPSARSVTKSWTRFLNGRASITYAQFAMAGHFQFRKSGTWRGTILRCDCYDCLKCDRSKVICLVPSAASDWYRLKSRNRCKLRDADLATSFGSTRKTISSFPNGRSRITLACPCRILKRKV